MSDTALGALGEIRRRTRSFDGNGGGGPGTLDVCPSGIADLDDLIDPGIPRGNTVLVSGPPGTGKTTLCLQFAAHGAKLGENAVYISATEPADRLVTFARRYDFYDPAEADEDRLVFLDMSRISDRLGLADDTYDLEEIRALADLFESLVREYDLERIVIDSITALCHHIRSAHRIRKFMYRLGDRFARLGCTTLMTSEVQTGTEGYAVYGVEDRIADGIIHMGDRQEADTLVRTLQIVKMRGCGHSRDRQVVDLRSEGISLQPSGRSRRP